MSSKLIVYRYDPRLFSPGEIIFPDFTILPRLNEGESAVEEAILRLAPDLSRIRKQALYTWQSKDTFERLITGLTRHTSEIRGKQYYELEIDETDILFKGNLTSYKEAANNKDSQTIFETAVRDYAKGCHLSDKIEYAEILVSKAKVLKRYDPQ